MTPSSLLHPLAIVDVETTGSSPLHDRIIEIGVARIEQGRAVETFSTLVDPGCPIPSYIEQMTGISSLDVEGAPAFGAIEARVHALLDGAIFVAHNVRFDYAFLRNEFERLGRAFSAPCLCTVRLSRLLYPGHARHNLSSLIERFGFDCPRRHRALDDAMVVWQFLQHAQATVEPERVAQAIRGLLKRPTLPSQLTAADIEALPSGPGVYIFYDDTGMPLYVGKSIDVRERVLSHFASDRRSSKELQLSQRVARIEAQGTYGELGALLLESHLIKQLSPLYNRLSRIRRQLVVLRRGPRVQGYERVRLDTLTSDGGLDAGDVLGVFTSRKQALLCLRGVARQHQLCLRRLGLEKGRGACVYRQMGQCRGACAGAVPAALHNAELAAAFQARRIKRWPYTGPVVIEERDPHAARGHLFLVDQWRLARALRYEDEAMSVFLPPEAVFDYDSYVILDRYLRTARRGIKQVSEAAAARICESADAAP